MMFSGRMSTAGIIFVFLIHSVSSEGRICVQDEREGFVVTVKCVPNDDHQNIAKETDITWKSKLVGSKSWTKILKNNRSEIQSCQNTDQTGECDEGNPLSLLHLQNFTSTDSGLYGCFTKNNKKIDRTRLIFGCPPSKVIFPIHGCILYAETNNVSCCWESIDRIDGQTNYTLSTTYYPPDEINHIRPQSRKKDTQCQTMNRSICCDAPIADEYQDYRVYLTARNKFGNTSSDGFEIMLCQHIKPGSPNITKAMPTAGGADGNEARIFVEWTVPSHGHGLFIRTYSYRIRYQKDVDTAWKIKEVPGDRTSYTIKGDDLKHNSYYAVQVAALPSGGIMDGLWSEWSERVMVRTNYAVPRKWFKFKQTEVSKTQIGNTTYYAINLSWEKYYATTEEGFFTNISCGNCSGEMRVYNASINTHLSFNTTLSEVCCIGEYCNKGGCANRESMQKIIPFDSFPNAPTDVYIDQSTLTFSKQVYNEDQLLFARICGRIRMKDKKMPLTQRVFSPSCLIDGFTTVERIKVFASHNTSKINYDFSPCMEYLIVLERYDPKSDIIFKSTPSQIERYDPDMPSVSEFILTDVSNSTCPAISASWTNITANEYMHWQLRYYAVGGAECQSKHENGCERIFFHRAIPSDVAQTTIRDNIFGSTRYKIEGELSCVTASMDGHARQRSQYSLRVNGAEDIITTVVTTPREPRNVSLSSYSVPRPVLKWEPPMHTNGPLFYKITTSNSERDIAKVSRTTKQIQEVDISCSGTDDNSEFTFLIEAINESKDKKLLRSARMRLQNVPCVSTTGKTSSSGAIIVIALMIISLFITLVVILLYCYRKKIKAKFQTRFGSPSPIINDNTVAKETVAYAPVQKNVTSELETYDSVSAGTFPKWGDKHPHPITPGDSTGINTESIATPEFASTLESNIAPSSTPQPDVLEYVSGETVIFEEAQSAAERVRNRTISELSSTPTAIAYMSDGSQAHFPVKQYVKVARKQDGDMNISDQSDDEDMSKQLGLRRYRSEDADLDYVTDNETCQSQKQSHDTNQSIKRLLGNPDAVLYSEVDSLSSPSRYTETDGFKNAAPSAEYISSSSYVGEPEISGDNSYVDDIFSKSIQNSSSEDKFLSHSTTRNRQSSSSSGILEDFNDCEEKLQFGLKDFLRNCVLENEVPMSSSLERCKSKTIHDDDAVTDTTLPPCNTMSMDDAQEKDGLISNDIESYVDFERATLLSTS